MLINALIKSNGQISIMALQLTYTMSINVGFVLELFWIPNLWSFVEYLFPFALIGFAILMDILLQNIFDYFQDCYSDFDFAKNNNLTYK